MVAKIITVLQQKGGSGKTTTTMNIAGGLLEKNFKVFVLDLDKDKPDAWSWAAKSDKENFVIQASEKKAREVLEDLKAKADFIVIDTPPNFQTAALKAALLGDLVIIPASPSGMDLSGLMEAKDLALTANKPYILLANKVLKNSNMSKSLLEVLENDKSFKTYISQSVKFVEAESIGKFIGEYAKSTIYHEQVKNLVNEICEFFENGAL